MKRKLLFILPVLAAMVVALAMPVATAQDEPFSVAAVAPSATNDLAFSQSMFDALTAVQEEMGEDAFEFTFIEGQFNVDDAAATIRDWAASGDYDLIIAHGSQYGAALEEIAPEFPEIAFAWGTDVNTFGLDNVSAYEAASQEGGYINGFVAGGLTQTDVIGVIGPIEVGDAKLYVDGFKAGVAAYAEEEGKEITVNVNYIQSFSDVALAAEAAETHLSNDADILTGTAQMVVGAIGVAQERGDVYWFGTQSSQTEFGGEIVVMNQVYHWEVVLMEIIANMEEGVLGGESYKITLENGGLEMEINPDFAGFESEEDYETLQEAVQILIDGIVAGDIEVLPAEEE
ncbi:MAG: BMP family protein [Anaerolineae bacterium]|nr:BMP family protein [Anaerolineae bacterium]